MIALILQFTYLVDHLFSNVQIILKQLNSQECESLLRQNAEYRYVINLLNECDKPLYSYKPLNGVENLRYVRIKIFFPKIANYDF